MEESHERGAGSSSALARSPSPAHLHGLSTSCALSAARKNPATSAYDAAGIAYCLRRAKELKWRAKSTHEQHGLYRISI